MTSQPLPWPLGNPPKGLGRVATPIPEVLLQRSPEQQGFKDPVSKDPISHTHFPPFGSNSQCVLSFLDKSSIKPTKLMDEQKQLEVK